MPTFLGGRNDIVDIGTRRIHEMRQRRRDGIPIPAAVTAPIVPKIPTLLDFPLPPLQQQPQLLQNSLHPPRLHRVLTPRDRLIDAVRHIRQMHHARDIGVRLKNALQQRHFPEIEEFRNGRPHVRPIKPQAIGIVHAPSSPGRLERRPLPLPRHRRRRRQLVKQSKGPLPLVFEETQLLFRQRFVRGRVGSGGLRLAIGRRRRDVLPLVRGGDAEVVDQEEFADAVRAAEGEGEFRAEEARRAGDEDYGVGGERGIVGEEVVVAVVVVFVVEIVAVGGGALVVPIIGRRNTAIVALRRSVSIAGIAYGIGGVIVVGAVFRVGFRNHDGGVVIGDVVRGGIGERDRAVATGGRGYAVEIRIPRRWYRSEGEEKEGQCHGGEAGPGRERRRGRIYQ
mmetsp:Transcript_20145/g.41421  ORF Transcript_20145/g.41421 Transcript_20145/m.41421 type:complete len:394 (+) Transcript_20145:2185-3366(+)